MKLTGVQLEILNLMANGWQLERSEGINPRAWLRKGCVTKDIRINSFFSLRRKGYIEKDIEGFPTTTFKLTGKEIPKGG